MFIAAARLSVRSVRPVPILAALAAMVLGLGLGCGPSTPHASTQHPGGATGAGGRQSDGGMNTVRGASSAETGSADAAREQSAPTTTTNDAAKLAGCGTGGACAGGVAVDAAAGNDSRATIGGRGADAENDIDVGSTLDSSSGGTDPQSGGDGATPKLMRDAARVDGGEPDAASPTDASVGDGGSDSGGTVDVSADRADMNAVGNAALPGAGDLAIVELLINPTGTDTGREWIEIVNRADHPVSLSNLHIADAANEVAIAFTSGPDAGVVANPQLAPGARAVLMQSGDPTKNGGVNWSLGTAAGTFGTLVSLNNDADTISVCAGACANGLLLDKVTWDATLGTGYDGHALIIDDGAHRCPATAPFGDAGSFGTPFTPNPTCP